VVRILENETYSGTWHWRKSTTRDGKRIQSEPDARIAVQVPPIISRETWEVAVARRMESKARRRGTTLRRYLLTSRVSCGLCGVAVSGRRSRERAYYCCPARDKSRTTHAHTCDLPYFRSEALEGVVWGWARSLLLDPAALEAGLTALRQQSESSRAPLRQCIQAIDAQLAALAQESAQLLDRYLAGQVAKDKLQERKQSLDERERELQRERAALLARLETQSLDDSALRDLRSFANQVAEGLAQGDDEELRRTVIDNLDVRIRLTVEDGAKLADARSILGAERLVIPSTT
jgi:hypothetical protein